MTDRLTELQDFMFDTMPSPEMSVDWFCDRFNVSATDDVLDFVLDAHEGMFADQWDKWHTPCCAVPQTVYCIEVNQTTPTMRKIESLMNRAISAGTDWKNANTQVINADGVSSVYLHGNLIAEITDEAMKIFDGGWQSNTTKSRLNALLSAFGHHGECVYQSDWTWYIRLWTGDDYATTEFRSGMRLA